MHERGRLQGVVRALAPHLSGGELAQLPVDDLEELIPGRVLAASRPLEDARDLLRLRLDLVHLSHSGNS